MKRAALWAALAIPILLNITDPFALWVLLVMGSIILLKSKSLVFIILTGCIFITVSLAQFIPYHSRSSIVELNDKSFIVSTKQGKVLVYTKTIEDYGLLDEVIIQSVMPFELTPTTYGFNQAAYYQTNDLIGYAEESSITLHKNKGIIAFLDSGGFNKDPAFKLLARAILFQSDPLTEFIALISLGLIYSILMKSGRYALSFFMSEVCALSIVSGMMLVLAFVFALPLSLIRVLVSVLLAYFVKNAKSRLILFVLFFLFYNPNCFKSIAVLYPLLFMVISAFKPRKLTQWSLISILQLGILHQASLLLIVVYPILKRILTIVIVLIWLGLFLPWINPLLFFIHDQLYAILSLLESVLIIRGSLSIPVVCIILVMVLVAPILKKNTSILFCLLVFCIPFLSSPWMYQVTVISVGQGDAILLQAPFNQEVILIDTGKESAYGQVSSFLNAQGISTLNALILTHADSDHNGNVLQLSEKYRIMRSVIEPKDLDLNWFHLKSLKTSIKYPTDNQASLVYLFEVAQLKFLLMADTDELAESDLLSQYPSLRADVLKVGHHGSASSTSDDFLSHIEAKLAVISVGHNSYGHPSNQTLHRLMNHKAMIMTTRDEGDITFIISPWWKGLKTSSLNLKTLRLGF